MTFTTSPISWLDHGEGIATFESAGEKVLQISNLSNINRVNVVSPSGRGAFDLRLDEFVDALNQIGFTVSTTTTEDLHGESRTLGPKQNPFELAWEQATPGAVKKGDRVISRTSGSDGVHDYGIFTAFTGLFADDPRVRVLEPAPEPEPEPLPEWMEAKVIRAEHNDHLVLAERDEDDDWLIYGLDENPDAGEYVYSFDKPQYQFTNVEVIA